MHLAGEMPLPDVGTKLENASPEDRYAVGEVLARLFGPGKPMTSTTFTYDPKGRRIGRVLPRRLTHPRITAVLANSLAMAA